jgi:broad specificity phosphatase PhoE
MRRIVMRRVTALVVTAAAAALTGCGADSATSAQSPPVVVTTADGASVVGPTSEAADPGTVVMIIRHGEKPDGSLPGVDAQGNTDDSSLTEVGWDRAHRLVELFGPAQGPVRAGLARPTAIYAAGVSDDAEGQRTRETVTPLADALGIPVDTDFGRGDEKKLAKEVAGLSGQTLISWQHGGIPDIVDAFPHVSPNPPTDWPDDRFDVVWTLTQTASGWHFAQLPERVLPQDQTGIIAG